jgi:arabinogalactan endo-1,4-beta-galactosidase
VKFPCAVLLLLTGFWTGWAQVRCGADLSFVPKLESFGAAYRDYGMPMPALEIFGESGFRIVRLRLWHSPAESWNGLDSTLAHAARIKRAGFELMLDLHYSDSWADPGQQHKPAAWDGLDFPVLCDSVDRYTRSVLRRFVDAGAAPDYVQIGNEIDPGMLWDDGRVDGMWDTAAQWNRLAQLLRTGIVAARDSLPGVERPRTILHLSAGGNNAFCRRFFDSLAVRDVAYDLIGLSFYPWWHGNLAALQNNLNDLAGRYDKEIMVVETAYPWTLDWNDDTGNIVGNRDQLLPDYPATPTGQSAFLRDLLAVVQQVPDQRGKAVLYWEPAWISTVGFGSPWENLALFDFAGNGLPGLHAWAAAAVEPVRNAAKPYALRVDVSPNPFYGTAEISVTLPEPAALQIRVYNLAGQQVATLADGRYAAGVMHLRWNAAGQASGLYGILVTVRGHPPQWRKALLVK